jgi:hypothetical protein
MREARKAPGVGDAHYTFEVRARKTSTLTRRLDERLVGGSVTGREVVNSTHEKRFTRFLIELSTNRGSCTLLLRYSELRKLHESLHAKFADEPFGFPGKKKLLGNNFNSDFLKERTRKLDEFVKKVTGTRPFCDLELVRRFFFDRKL